MLSGRLAWVQLGVSGNEPHTKEPNAMNLLSSSLTSFPASLLLLSSAASAQSQVLFSIDWNGPTVGQSDCASVTQLTEGDILIPCLGVPALGPLGRPMVAITGGFGGLGLSAHAGAVGHPGGTVGQVEVDAFSTGRDDRFQPNFPLKDGELWFSVDEFATGFPGAPALPNILSEAPVGDSATDVMVNIGSLPPAPMPPLVGVATQLGVLDGDGLTSGSGYAYPGLGLAEPNLPSAGPSAGGDNLDALGFRDAASDFSAYFSLDGSTTLWDPCAGVPGTGSASAQGFSGADVLRRTSAAPVLFAPAPMLGLDLLGGPGSDDLDALILAENGDGVYQVSSGPYDWMSGATDMLMFSVRRGSAVIGAPDSIFGIPIEEGDILVPPMVGGVSPFPGIWIPAENLGLRTQRSGPVSCGADELDALSHHRLALIDCNGNGVEDALDIHYGSSLDLNQNGIPDECESPILVATPYCSCPVGPCGNNYAAGGCRNSTGVGALLTASGSSSWAADDLVLTVSQAPNFQFGIVYMGTVQIGPLPFADGLRCVGGNICRLPLRNTGATGSYSYGPGIIGLAGAAGCPVFPGDIWNFQGWFRDPAGPCGNGFNLSNAVEVTFY